MFQQAFFTKKPKWDENKAEGPKNQNFPFNVRSSKSPHHLDYKSSLSFPSFQLPQCKSLVVDATFYHLLVVHQIQRRASITWITPSEARIFSSTMAASPWLVRTRNPMALLLTWCSHIILLQERQLLAHRQLAPSKVSQLPCAQPER